MNFARPWFRQSSPQTYDYMGPIVLFSHELNALLPFGSFEFFAPHIKGKCHDSSDTYRFQVCANSTERAIAILKEVKFLTMNVEMKDPIIEISNISGQLNRRHTEKG